MYKLAKRTFDILASLIGIVFLLPFMLLIALLIKINMPGPVLFRQIRTGRFGRPFIIVKFRTMIVGHKGNTISVQGENRITPFGSILRKYKLDELPELWNVLIGEMSFVGPRPDVQKYTDLLKGEERKILELKPGITGPASLKFANEEELLSSVEDPLYYNDSVLWPQKVKYNLQYYYNRSFMGDLRIIFKTIFR